MSEGDGGGGEYLPRRTDKQARSTVSLRKPENIPIRTSTVSLWYLAVLLSQRYRTRSGGDGREWMGRSVPVKLILVEPLLLSRLRRARFGDGDTTSLLRRRWGGVRLHYRVSRVHLCSALYEGGRGGEGENLPSQARLPIHALASSDDLALRGPLWGEQHRALPALPCPAPGSMPRRRRIATLSKIIAGGHSTKYIQR